MLEYLTLNLKLRTSTYPYRLFKGEFGCDCSDCYDNGRMPRLPGVIAFGCNNTPWVALLRNGLQYTNLCTPEPLPLKDYLPVTEFLESQYRTAYQKAAWRTEPLAALIVLEQEYAGLRPSSAVRNESPAPSTETLQESSECWSTYI